MEGWLGAEGYVWFKALHLIAVIFWMAALFMMPRYLAYHAEYAVGSEEELKWREREARLSRIIMNPTMMVAWLLGLGLLLNVGFDAGGWLHAKLALVVLLTVFHVMVSSWRKSFLAGENSRSGRFYRLANEIPAVFILLIVILVIIKPF